MPVVKISGKIERSDKLPFIFFQPVLSLKKLPPEPEDWRLPGKAG